MANQWKVLGVNLIPSHRIHYALQRIYGVGPHQANCIIAKLGYHPDTRVATLEDDMPRIRSHIEEHYPTKLNQLKAIGENIMRKININCFQGQRHLYGLAVNGQRSRRNRNSQRRMTVVRSRLMGIPIAHDPKKVDAPKAKPKIDPKKPAAAKKK